MLAAEPTFRIILRTGFTTEVDTYAKNQASMKKLGVYEFPGQELLEFVRELNNTANANGIKVVSCAEQMDLAQCGVEHSSCIDKRRMEETIGCNIEVGKDKNQRAECGCMESVDIGTYNTCNYRGRQSYRTQDKVFETGTDAVGIAVRNKLTIHAVCDIIML